MYKIWWCLPSLFLIFILIHRGESIYCFTCQAPNNSSNACVQHVSLETTAAVNCSRMGNYLFCMSALINGTVIRRCAATIYDCLDRKGQQMNCNLCSGDYCNSGYVNTSMPATRGVQPGDRRLQPIPTTLRPADAKPAAGAMIEAQLLPTFICFFSYLFVYVLYEIS